MGACADFIAATATLFGVLVFDTLGGLVLGVAVSILLLVYWSSHPNVARLGLLRDADAYVDLTRHPDAVSPPGVVVVRVEGGLFFANIDQVETTIMGMVEPGVRAVVLDAMSVPFIDVSATRMLVRMSDELESSGVDLLMARERRSGA